MQSITFNNATQCKSVQTFNTVEQWLGFIYAHPKSGPQLISTPNIHSLDVLETVLEYNFQDKTLLFQALTHTTYTHESIGNVLLSNQRLEFLGDSVVNLIITSVLYKKFPDFSEGELSKFRGALVNEKMFAALASVINLSENIFLGRGEWKQRGQMRPSLLADSFEALLGAIYLEGGMSRAEHSFQRVVELYETSSNKDFFSSTVLVEFDAKTQLQELCMSLYQEHPRYVSKDVAGGFLVSVWLKDKCLIEEKGPSKKKLEKELAKIVLSEKKYQI